MEVHIHWDIRWDRSWLHPFPASYHPRERETYGQRTWKSMSIVHSGSLQIFFLERDTSNPTQAGRFRSEGKEEPFLIFSVKNQMLKHWQTHEYGFAEESCCYPITERLSNWEQMVIACLDSKICTCKQPCSCPVQKGHSGQVHGKMFHKVD